MKPKEVEKKKTKTNGSNALRNSWIRRVNYIVCKFCGKGGRLPVSKRVEGRRGGFGVEFSSNRSRNGGRLDVTFDFGFRPPVTHHQLEDQQWYLVFFCMNLSCVFECVSKRDREIERERERMHLRNQLLQSNKWKGSEGEGKKEARQLVSRRKYISVN